MRAQFPEVMAARLPLSFYRRADVVRISRALLGRYLFTRIGGNNVTGGIIVETEAYAGATDRASHAYGNRRTRRTEVMFQAGGVAYVYLCYGLHCLFNIITNVDGVPHAVLVRGIFPTHGLDVMRARRRGLARSDRLLAAGPGTLTQALGITLAQNGVSLLGDRVWLEDGLDLPDRCIIAAPRVGVAYAGADAQKPWRFMLRGDLNLLLNLN